MIKTLEDCCGMTWIPKGSQISSFFPRAWPADEYFTKGNVLLFYCLTACPNMAVLQGTSGIITSPSYPGNYGNNHRCSWKIIASTGNRVKLVILNMDIESGTNCPYDSLQIQNGVLYPSGVTPGKLCGSLTSNSTFTSHRETLIVRFVTDGSVTKRGFRARYTIIPNRK